jgi:hypothetical protein
MQVTVQGVPIGTGSKVTLPDGRRLGFAEWGDPAGIPVLDFRGLSLARATGTGSIRHSWSRMGSAGSR